MTTLTVLKMAAHWDNHGTKPTPADADAHECDACAALVGRWLLKKDTTA